MSCNGTVRRARGRCLGEPCGHGQATKTAVGRLQRGLTVTVSKCHTVQCTPSTAYSGPTRSCTLASALGGRLPSDVGVLGIARDASVFGICDASEIGRIGYRPGLRGHHHQSLRLLLRTLDSLYNLTPHLCFAHQVVVTPHHALTHSCCVCSSPRRARHVVRCAERPPSCSASRDAVRYVPSVSPMNVG